MKTLAQLRHLLFIVTVLLAGIGNATAQTPSIQWQKALGGSKNDLSTSVAKTSDGGYIIAASSYTVNDGDVWGNHGYSDCWIVRLNTSGDTLWEKSFGGSGIELAASIQQTTDGGFVFAGSATSSDGDVLLNKGGYDCWVVKLSSSGSIQWQKTLGGSENDFGSSIKQTTDGGYILAAYSESNDGDVTGNHGDADYWVVKLSSSGNILWQKATGGSGFDKAESVQQTTDGGYIVAGLAESSVNGDVTGGHGGWDYWVLKFDGFGNIIWKKTYGGSNQDFAYSVIQTSDGSFLIAGGSSSNNYDVTGNHGGEDFWLVKTDALGNLLWQKSLGGSNTDQAHSIIQTLDGGYIVIGASASSDGQVTVNHADLNNNPTFDYWIVKLDNTGNLVWQESLGGSKDDGAYSILQTANGDYVICGGTYSGDGDVTGKHESIDPNEDVWIVKLEAECKPSIIPNGATTFCSGGNVILSAHRPTAGSLQWKKNGTNISGATVAKYEATASGNYTVVLTSAYCGSVTSSPVIVTVNTIPAKPTSITVSGGSAAVCPGDIRSYSVNVVKGVTSYNWTAFTGAIIGATSDFVTISVSYTSAFTALSGTLKVAAVNVCGSSATQSLIIKKNIPPAPSTPQLIFGSVKVCPGDACTYKVNAVTGFNYNWTAFTGADITTGLFPNIISVNYTNSFTASSGKLSVAAVNACGAGPASTLTINRNTPTAPGTPVLKTGPVKVCPGDICTYKVTPVTGLTYSWTGFAGATVTPGLAPYNSVTVHYTNFFTALSGKISVVAVNGCGKSSASTLTISRNDPVKPGAISGLASVCQNSPQNYFIAPVANAVSYLWTLPASDIFLGQGSTSINAVMAVGGTIKVQSSNACGLSPSNSRTVSVVSCREEDEILSDKKFELYPNPSYQSIFVNVSGFQGTTEMSITNLLAQEVYHGSLDAAEENSLWEINVADFANGVYLIKLMNGSSVTVKKFVKD